MSNTSLGQLYAKLNSLISNSLEVEVAEVVKQTMYRNIYTVVYNVYTPKRYKRQMDSGGLSDMEKSMSAEMVDNNTLKVRNIRRAFNEDSQSDIDVAQVIESGQGYTRQFEYTGIPRPFTEATRRELKKTKNHIKAMKQGLKRNGLKMRNGT
jgi:hypothetical protein